MSKIALVLRNPNARSGQSQSLEIKQAFQSLHNHGYESIELKVNSAEALQEAVQQHPQAELLIVCGGDGSMNFAAQALYNSNITLGVMPLGTANDLARTLKIPADPVPAMDIMLNGSTHEIDLGEVNGRLFFNVAHIGLSIQVTEELTSNIKQQYGVFAYLIAAWRARQKAKPFKAQIETKEFNTTIKTVQLSVGNGRNFGGGMVVAEDARIDDGSLDAYSLRSRSWWDLFKIAIAMRRGVQGWFKTVDEYNGSQLKITTEKPQDITADGEPAGQTPAEFRVIPKAVKVRVPQPYLAAMQNAKKGKQSS